MKSKKPFLYYMNPKNVSAAIETYGYTYRIKNTILVYLIVTVCSIAGGVVFQLDLLEIGIVAVCGMAMMPRIIINSYKNMYEQKRFSDVNIYMEKVLKSCPKILQCEKYCRKQSDILCMSIRRKIL